MNEIKITLTQEQIEQLFDLYAKEIAWFKSSSNSTKDLLDAKDLLLSKARAESKAMGERNQKLTKTIDDLEKKVASHQSLVAKEVKFKEEAIQANDNCWKQEVMLLNQTIEDKDKLIGKLTEDNNASVKDAIYWTNLYNKSRGEYQHLKLELEQTKKELEETKMKLNELECLCDKSGDLSGYTVSFDDDYIDPISYVYFYGENAE